MQKKQITMAQQTVSKMERVQTAVEWLISELNKINFQATQDEHYTIDRLFEQAKQMEKKQHRHTWLYEGDIDNASYERFKRYYQINFGGQGSPDTSLNTQNK